MGEEPVDQSPPKKPFGSAGEEAPGVLRGGMLVRVNREGQEDLWMMAYEWPRGTGKFVAWQFDNVEQVQAAFGQEWWKRVDFRNRNETWMNNTVSVLSSASEIVGVQGNFRQLMNASMREAAEAAGVDDPGLQGLIANSREWQEIVAESTLGNWTEDQLMAQLRKTDLWTKQLYPGISSLYGQTTDPEGAWISYQRNVESSLESLGYGRDPDGSYRQAIGQMLAKGIGDQLFVDAVPTFIRAEGSTAYRAALGKWTQAELGKDLDFNSWFDVLAGEAAPEIGRVLELAQLQYAANTAAVGASDSILRRLAADTNMSEADALAAFNSVERNLLALGDSGLGRYGLTQDELISAFAGIQAPSGRSIEQVRLLAQKAAVEIGLSDDVNTELFVGFTERGTPERTGLKALSPERA